MSTSTVNHQHPPGSINAMLVERGLRKEKRAGTLIFSIYDADGREVYRGAVSEIGAWLEADCPEWRDER
jgi:hypothetical protein